MKLTKNFTLEELIRSQTATAKGIDNTPNQQEQANLTKLATNVLQPARDVLGFAITVTSGYRCPELNKAVGGSSTSSHMNGEAADLKCKNNAELYHYIERNLAFDQLIWEKGNDMQPAWVHVSFREGNNRMQTLRIK